MREMEGGPGMGKSQILFLLNKPKWMPVWLHRWREKRAWVRWQKDKPLIIALPTLEPRDLALPFDPLRKHLHTVKPRPLTKKDTNDAE